VGAALLVLPALASADCGDEILTQATQQGAVTGKYPLKCYDQALAKIDPDLEEYGEAPGIIRAAKAARRTELNAQDEPRDPAAITSEDPGQEQPAGGGDDQPSDGPAPIEGSGDAEASSGDAPDTEAVEPSTDELNAGAPVDSTEASTVAAPSIDDGGDGPPTPVLLLGGAAIVLIGVGTGGMVYRRFLQR
jgi:hypothetical protein